MNDKLRLKRASDPLVLLPSEGTGGSTSLALSFACRALSAYLRRCAMYPSLLSLYSRAQSQIYNFAGQDSTFKEIRATPCIIQYAQK